MQQEPKVQFGVSDSADFEENTWAFSMDGNYRVQGGRHAIMTENEFLRLLEAAKENLRLQEVAVDNVRLRKETVRLRKETGILRYALRPLANSHTAIDRARLTSEDCLIAQLAIYGEAAKKIHE